MPTLPLEWLDHLAEGVSVRVGSCSRDGRPGICRALAADLLPDGRMFLLVTGDAGGDVLDGIRETGQVAVTLALPMTYRTLHLKGRDATVAPAGSEHQPLLSRRFDAFAHQLLHFGFKREDLAHYWYTVREGDMHSITFRIYGAWNQTPGPGAGQVVELVDLVDQAGRTP